ncbi:hypothetical protein DFH06DRAFT_1227789 [Mycena polygramma]|nr:hypothetical protein DFH06DRAFT_1227789 [Mycena polygramma]
MVTKAADIGYQKPVPYGLVLKPCGHVFCGACLAQTIYQNLNMAFDRATYGTKLPSYAPDVVCPDRPEFPISCPVCHTKKHGKQRELREIDDTTARLVLGESNMDEWNHARFLSTLRRIHCPHKGCNHTFDTDDAIPSNGFPPNEARVHCPRCRGALCRPCKSIWHDGVTCLMYQASAPYDPTPADFVPKKEGRRRGWAPMLRTQNRDSYSQDRQLYSPGSMHSPGSSDSLSPGPSPYSPGESPYTPGESPHRPGAPPWAHEKKSHLPYA